MAGRERMRLTDAAVERLRPREREYTVWDDRTPGLGVRIRPGGGKSYVWLQRSGGRSKRISLGPVSLRTIAEARRDCLARQLTLEPDRESVPRRRAPSFREFVEGEWKDAHFERYKPSTITGVRSLLASQLLPEFGSIPLDRIAPARVRRWFDAFSRTAPVNANRGLDVLRQIMNFAIASGHTDANPAAGIQPNRRPKLTRFLSREEIARLHRVLDGQAGRGNRQQAEVIRLLLLTGCRRGEIVHLRWSEVQGDMLMLADSKTGPRTVPPQFAGPVYSRTTAAGRESVRVSVAARSVSAAPSRLQALVPGPEGSRHRGCAPPRPPPYRGQPRGDERRAGAGGLAAARTLQCPDDPALRSPRRPRHRTGRRKDRQSHRQENGAVAAQPVRRHFDGTLHRTV